MKINNVQIRLQKINKAIFWPRKYFPLAVVRTRFLVLYYNKGQRADRTLEERLNRGGGGEEAHWCWWQSSWSYHSNFDNSCLNLS